MTKKESTRKSFKELYGYERDDESAPKRFKRLATIRLNNVLNGMTSLKRLGKGNYTYTEEQATYITDSLDKAIEDVKTSFSGTKEAKAKAEIPD